MRLLVDQNLSFRLPRRLADIYPNSLHLRDAGLFEANDRDIWRYAAENGLAIVTKDSDFQELALRHGPPPKVVWLRLGNCPTSEVESVLRRRHADLVAFGADADRSLLELF